MNEQWFKEYVLLAFRLDTAIRKFTESRFVDYYYGPPEWKAEAEAEKPTDELVRDAMALEDTLPEQGFEAHRVTYLEKQVGALETVCRKMNGETFSLEEEVQRCFDIHQKGYQNPSSSKDLPSSMKGFQAKGVFLNGSRTGASGINSRRKSLVCS